VPKHPTKVNPAVHWSAPRWSIMARTRHGTCNLMAMVAAFDWESCRHYP
jgi:hypothetical protein